MGARLVAERPVVRVPLDAQSLLLCGERYEKAYKLSLAQELDHGQSVRL
jgi:hypothetical protein